MTELIHLGTELDEYAPKVHFNEGREGEDGQSCLHVLRSVWANVDVDVSRGHC